MRRNTFLKSLAAIAMPSGLALNARAATALKLMIPANPGGGYDLNGRAIGKAIVESGGASSAKTEAALPGRSVWLSLQARPRATLVRSYRWDP